MSVMRFVVILCDHDDARGPCNEESDPEWTVAAARQGAQRKGWVRRKGRDLCPVHAAEASR